MFLPLCRIIETDFPDARLSRSPAMSSAPAANGSSHADGSTSPLSLNSPSSSPATVPLQVRVEPAAAPKTPLLSVHEEAEHLYPAFIEWSRPCQSVGVTGSFNK
jgi:hypothetical protein